MSKRNDFIRSLLVLVVVLTLLTSCDFTGGESSQITRYNSEMESSTGKWQLLDDEDTYFVFDGAENVMTVSYYEDRELKHSGKFRANYDPDADAQTPLTFIITRKDKAKEDWVSCYVENFESEFTQFSVMYEQEDLGVTDGTVYTHIYRISEMPYKIGTYVLENKEYKPFSKTGFDDGTYRIPEGNYMTENGQTLRVLPIMNRSYLLFQYVNGEEVIEGIFNIAQDRRTIYLYIEHDIYEKVRESDKKDYDTTFSLNYPPDFYLRGNFDTDANSLVIDGLYHHDYSPTEIDDAVWVFGTYNKQ